tara:strand:- start:208 stop:549 length:342 start_codon:yes stop_codon:yes gene_type:complete
MKYVILGLVGLVMLTGVSEARRSRKKSSNKYYYTYTSSVDNSSAQGVANTMASRNCVAHFGGHYNSYEGCGSGWTQNQAYNNCCYSNSGMAVIDVGYAQGSNGMWYCCKRYVK